MAHRSRAEQRKLHYHRVEPKHTKFKKPYRRPPQEVDKILKEDVDDSGSSSASDKE
jgi:hypothetical protein